MPCEPTRCSTKAQLMRQYEGTLHTKNRFNKPVNVTALGGTAIGIAGPTT